MVGTDIINIYIVPGNRHTHMAGTAEENTTFVAIFLGTAGAALGVTGLRTILIDDAVEFLLGEEMSRGDAP